MAVWYEVERSGTGIENFMECNWRFHDFKIERAVYLPENRSAELFLKYEETKGSVILRFLNVHAMRVVLDMEYGFPAEIGGKRAASSRRRPIPVGRQRLLGQKKQSPSGGIKSGKLLGAGRKDRLGRDGQQRRARGNAGRQNRSGVDCLGQKGGTSL